MIGRSSLLALCLVSALGPLACDAPPSDQPRSRGAGADDAGAAALSGDAESCASLTTAICEESGSESSTCESVRATAALLSPNTCAVALADMAFTSERLSAAKQGCADLAGRLCKELGEDTQTCEMVRSQTPELSADQCAKMNADYEAVLAELERMEAQNKPLAAAAVAKIAALGAPAFGPEDARVTLVEFSDFQCPYCSKAAAAIAELKPRFGAEVRFVFRQFPLSFHADAHLAAEASLAAHAEGQFWAFHDKLFANQGALARQDLEGYASELGLDIGAFKSALDSGTYKAVVDAELELGQEVFVDGTPTIFVNGVRVANSTDVSSIASELERALKG